MTSPQTHKHYSVAQFGVAMILFATFFPATLRIAGGFVALSIPGLPDTLRVTLYLLLETLIFAGIIWALGRRNGQFDFDFAIPYRRALNPILFLVLLALVTAYAIYFRDYFRWAPLSDFATFLSEKISFWPPEWMNRPRFDFEDENASKLVRLITLGVGMVSIGAASFMQTFYFRGFLLPRMEFMGWGAPFLNTALFAMFHLHSPAFWHLFFIFTLGWGIVTFAVRNVWIASISHVIFNTYAFLFWFGDLARA